MTTQRSALAVLILVETIAFAYMSETVVFPAMIVAAVLIGWQGRFRYQVSHDRQVILSLVTALLFVVRWRVQPHSLFEDSMAYLSPFLHSLGQFLLVLQTAALYLQYENDVLPNTLPWPGVFVMVSAGDILVVPSQRFTFQLLAIAFTAATGLFFTASARAVAGTERWAFGSGKAALVIVLLIAIGGFAWTGSAALHRYERVLDRMVTELLNPDGAGSAGFPNRSRLGNVAKQKSERSKDVALRVNSAIEPGYLRGKGYHWLVGMPGITSPHTTQWNDTAVEDDNASIGEILRPAGKVGDRFRFELHDTPDRMLGPPMEVWLEAPQWGIYFLPPSASTLVTSEIAVRRDYRQVVSDGDGGVVRYTVQEGAPRAEEPYFDFDEPTGTFSREALTSYPRRDGSVGADPAIKQLVNDVFAGCTTVEEHVQAVEDYFQGNYGYTIGIDIPPPWDPIHYFLRNKPNAHCEYFAQGAALLLRMRGIPTRYMTGFVVAEWNSYGNYWLARNEHAHAWCEAWDPEKGWVIVEATPPAGVPSPEEAPTHRQLWEYLSGQLAKFRHLLAEGGWRWLLLQTLAFLTTPAGVAVTLLVLGYVAVRIWMTRKKVTGPQVAPLVLELQRELQRMDARLNRIDIKRKPGETLTRFANRVSAETGDESIAGWYLDYVDARYDGVPEEKDVAALRERGRNLHPRRRPQVQVASEVAP